MSEPPAIPPPASRGFQLNGPTLVGLLYIATYFTAITVLVGVVLAYVWKAPAEARGQWEHSHYLYLIRTFWLGVIGYLALAALVAGMLWLTNDPFGSTALAAAGLALAVAGGLAIIGLTVVLIVRCVISLVHAQQGEPMPRPRSWTL